MVCHSWLQTEYDVNENSTLDQIDSAFRDWNLGGLIFVSLIILPGIIGNVLIFVIYWEFKRSCYRTFVLWLASLDLAGCVFTMPYLLYNLSSPVKMSSDWLCKSGKFVSYTLGMTSHFVLVIIAIDRHRKICKPYCSQMPARVAYRYCILVLVLAMFFSSPAAILYGNRTIDYGIPGLAVSGTRCFTSDAYSDTNYALIHYSVINILGGIVTGVMCVLYYQIIRQIKRQYDFKLSRKTRHSSFVSGRSEEDRQNKRVMRTAKTFFAITFIFVVTVFPHTILSLIDYIFRDFYCELSFKSGFAFNTAMYIFLLNNVSNCFIYGFSDERFQMKIKDMFRNGRQRTLFSSYPSLDYASEDHSKPKTPKTDNIWV